ncbi:MAG TPA: hypothetical protein VJK48_03435 [Chlamydiales bacterium]|nr:hypothetical protein [Chlamydiales bacterium]
MNLEEKAERKLEEFFPQGRLQLTWHENKSSFLSFRKEKGKVSLRLHRLFAKTAPNVLEALSHYVLKGDRESAAHIRKAAHLHFSKAKTAPLLLEATGDTYDLEIIYKFVKKRYFSSDLDISIGWAKGRRIGTFRSITFGTYDRYRNQIQIHPLLDSSDIPYYFLEFVVFHEMLHAVSPPRIDRNGRIISHTREFRSLEKKFAHYEVAKEWEKKSLPFFRRKIYGRA